MVESEAHELDEETMLGAVMHGHREYQKVIDLIIDLAEAAAKEPWALTGPHADLDKVKERVAALAERPLSEAYSTTVTQERRNSSAQRRLGERLFSQSYYVLC